MKTYGQRRGEVTKRKRKGTSVPCPCCIPDSTHRKRKTKAYKKRARQAAKKELR